MSLSTGIFTTGKVRLFKALEFALLPVSMTSTNTVPPVAIRFTATPQAFMAPFMTRAKYPNMKEMTTPMTTAVRQPIQRFCVNALAITPVSAQISMVPSIARLNIPDFVIILAARVASITGVVLASTVFQNVGDKKNSIMLPHLLLLLLPV